MAQAWRVLQSLRVQPLRSGDTDLPQMRAGMYPKGSHDLDRYGKIRPAGARGDPSGGMIWIEGGQPWTLGYDSRESLGLCERRSPVMSGWLPILLAG